MAYEKAMYIVKRSFVCFDVVYVIQVKMTVSLKIRLS